MADKVTLATLSTFTNDTSAVTTTNNNYALLTTAMDNTLSRDGTQPNSMLANLDMNSNHLLNLPSPISPDEPVRLIDLQTLTGTGSVTFNGLPTGGVAGNVLVKNSSTNFDASWTTITVFNGGTTGQVLTKNSNTNFDFSWQNVPNPTLPTSGNGILFQDTAHVAYNAGTTISVIAPGHDSVVGNGSTDDTTAINNILNGSATDIWVTSGTYKINGITVTSGKRIRILGGAKFSITTGNILDFSGSHVDAPKHTQCFILAGTAGVVGLNESTPEMFGAARNGSTDDSGAIIAAINAVMNIGAHNSIGPGICYLANGGTYFISNSISLTIPTNGRLKLYGGGQSTADAPLILASSSIGSANAALSISGAAGQYDIEVKDIRIFNQTVATGASTGLAVGRNSSGLFQSSVMGGIKFENVYVSGFATGITQINARQILWNRCAVWPFDNSGTSTSGAVALQMIAAGSGANSFVGDTRFECCQFVGSSLVNDTLVSITDNGTASQNLGGIMFHTCDFYSGTNKTSPYIACNISATGNGTLIADVWFDTCQFENQSTNGAGTCINGVAGGGGEVTDLHVVNNYIDGFGWGTGVQLSINDTASSNLNHNIIGNFFLNPITAAVNVQGNSGGGGTSGYNVSCNNVFFGVNATNMFLFQNLVGDVVCNNNAGFFHNSTPTVTNGVNFAGIGSHGIAVGNNTKATNPTVSGSWTNLALANNL